jgi:hypothetical protein
MFLEARHNFRVVFHFAFMVPMECRQAAVLVKAEDDGGITL